MGLQNKPALPNRPGHMRMAIYSLHHQPIGKSTQARPHTSAAHVRYITRPSAASRIEARRMPETPGRAAAYMREVEDADRKNARVSDKLMLALPRELDDEQRAQLVRDFAEGATQGRAPWLAAFHDQGKDALNPHAHLVIRDRDPATGRRVAGLSEKGSTERLRALWETHTNRALEQAGRPERIDRRTLEAQGITREPTVHEGPKAQQMERRGAKPTSRMRRYRNRAGSRLPYRDIDYRKIDGGRSRPGYNRQVGQRGVPVDYWEAVDADNLAHELEELRAIHHPPQSIDVLSRDVGRRVQPLQSAKFARIVNIGRSRLGLFQAKPDGQDFQLPYDFIPDSQRPEAQSLSERKSPHDSIVYDFLNEEGSEKMAREDFQDRLQQQIDDKDEEMRISSGNFDRLMDQSYADKIGALEKMEEFRKDQGADALFHRLRETPESFGAPPTDSAMRNDSENARKELAPAYQNHRKLGDEKDGLQRTLDAEKDRVAGGPPRGLDRLRDARLDREPSRNEALSQPTDRGNDPARGGRPAEPVGQVASPRPGGQKPQRLPTPGEVHNPWAEKTQPERNPSSQQRPTPSAAGPTVGNSPPKSGPDAPEGSRHPLSRQSPALTKPQLTPTGAAPPIAPQQALSQNPLQTPVQQHPIKQPRRGLDEGR